ncbi:muramidase [Stappia phage SI01]|uniref:Muramidase n=1 Tax=Stappia phage SI01 TaxID=2847766 RepID=A0AAE7SR92_9CAUD|nr:muramidase [Stappia phage SI01]
MSTIDTHVPAAARVLLDFISGPESRGMYEAWSGFKQDNLPKNLLLCTIDEVLEFQRRWTNFGGLSSAAGRYQIIRKTLVSLVRDLDLTGKEKFDRVMQDRLGYELLLRRGYEKWLGGKLGDKAFANALAKEWASLPVATRMKNYRGVVINPGTSYYAGDGLNSHGVGVGLVLIALKQARESAAENVRYFRTHSQAEPNMQSIPASPVAEEPASVPVPQKKTGRNTAIAVGVGAAGCGGYVASDPESVDTIVQITQTVMPLITNYGLYGIGALAAVAGVFFAVKYFRAR